MRFGETDQILSFGIVKFSFTPPFKPANAKQIIIGIVREQEIFEIEKRLEIRYRQAVEIGHTEGVP